MARHKKFEAPPEEDPVLDISSLIDCCFLLLIYFLVATTIVQERKLDIEIPASTQSDGQPPKLQPGNIKIMADGAIEWGKGDTKLQVGPPDPGYDPDKQKQQYSEIRRCPQLVEQLKELKATADAAATKLQEIKTKMQDMQKKTEDMAPPSAADMTALQQQYLPEIMQVSSELQQTSTKLQENKFYGSEALEAALSNGMM